MSSAPASYSAELTSASSYFERHEKVIDSVDDLHMRIRLLTGKLGDTPLVWRGVRDASWGLHSTLFRALMKLNGVKQPEDAPEGPQPFPDEDQMVAAEAKLLRVARAEWRFDGTPALELLAKLQHFGAPTRLLDVSRNPYIAAWFAVEDSEDEEDEPARLFALATLPVGVSREMAGTELVLDDANALYLPFWHYFTPDDRQPRDWGTGAKRRVWVPPAYDPRIVAQNAAFVIDGVPMVSSKNGPLFKKGEGMLKSSGSKPYWSKADLLAASSIFAKTADPSVTPRSNQANLAPTFSFRITTKAKKQIRQYLERQFGYTLATVYPDIARLSQHLRDGFDDIVSGEL